MQGLSLAANLVLNSLIWWLPANNANLHLIAASGVMLLVVILASINTAKILTLFTVIPAIILLPSSLYFHTQNKIAAFICFVLALATLPFGFHMLNVLLNTILLRHRADSLADALRIEKLKAEKFATLQERERLMRDMHDGLGSSLTSTLALMELGTIDLQDAALLVRDCVDDLRLVIDSLEPVDNDLVALLATIRYRLENRLAIAGITIFWEMHDLPKLSWLSATNALHLMRIIQEALTNTIRHSRASQIIIRAQPQGDGIELIIKDNGCGFNFTEVTPGRGLKNQQSRALQIGVHLTIFSGGGDGTTLHLYLPTIAADISGFS